MGLVFVLGMGMYFYGCPNTLACNMESTSVGKEIFDACVKVIPPLITLVLGYYFGSKTSRSD